MSEPAATSPIASITVGTRYRKQLGDLQPLMHSMRTVGLLHPIVITADNRLIAGARRLAAAHQLGWTEIPCRVIDLDNLLQAEHDENVLREPFLPSEAVAIGMAIEEKIAARNAVKMREAGKEGGRGKKKNPGTNNTRVSQERDNTQRTAFQAAKAAGMGGTTYTKAKAVVLAADAEPEKYGDLLTQMDASGSVDKSYQTLSRRMHAEVLPGKTPHQLAHEAPGRRWHQALHDLQGLMNSVQHFAEGDFQSFMRAWNTEYRLQSAQRLKDIRAVLAEWIVALEDTHNE